MGVWSFYLVDPRRHSPKSRYWYVYNTELPITNNQNDITCSKITVNRFSAASLHLAETGFNSFLSFNFDGSPDLPMLLKNNIY